MNQQNNDRSYIDVSLANNYRFEVVDLGERSRKRYIATVYGDPLPRNGLIAYGFSPWDAISNAAIMAANLEYRIIQESKKPPSVEAPVKTKSKKKAKA